jgi:cyclopropane fatty-acyl-phospholipid synthase-like methyltransferase
VTNPLPFSQPSENNKQVILDILKRHLATADSLLEIGGGSGQHAVFFAEQFPRLRWQSSDIPSNVDSLNLRIAAAQLPNLPAAFALDVNDAPWNCCQCKAIYTANSLHIMSADSVENFFDGVAGQLQEGGRLMVYGPFRYDGAFTTESNARFDLWLKGRDPLSGIRDFEWVNSLASNAGLQLLEDNAMPANNQFLIWKKFR